MKDMKNTTLAVLVLTALLLPSSVRAHQKCREASPDYRQDIGLPGDTGQVCATIGMIYYDVNQDIENPAWTLRPAVCWRSSVSPAVENLVLLSSSTTLTSDGVINITTTSGSTDEVVFIGATQDPDTNCDCYENEYLNSANKWAPLAYNGYYLDVSAQYSTEDWVRSGSGTGDTISCLNGGDDYCENRSTIGVCQGEAGDDDLGSIVSSGSDLLQGGSGDDCLYDSSASWDTCDCGSHDDGDYTHNYSTTPSCSNCEDYSYLCGGLF